MALATGPTDEEEEPSAMLSGLSSSICSGKLQIQNGDVLKYVI